MHLGLALGSPIFPSGCEGKLGVALESLHEKDPRPGPLFEGNPVGEGTTRRGIATPCIVRKDPRVPQYKHTDLKSSRYKNTQASGPNQLLCPHPHLTPSIPGEEGLPQQTWMSSILRTCVHIWRCQW